MRPETRVIVTPPAQQSPPSYNNFQIATTATGEKSSPGSELVHLDMARQAIQKAASIDAVKTIRDKAEVLRIYARQAGQSLEMQNICAEIKLRAERRAGEMLEELDKNKGSRGKGVRCHDASTPTLEEIGISQSQSSRWQKMALISEAEFESFIAERKAKGKELTSVAVLRLAREIERQIKNSFDSTNADQVAPLHFLVGKKSFSTLVVNPPWSQWEAGEGSRLLKHDTMTFDEIVTLPISKLCAKDSHLYLWVTNKSLRRAFECVERWGFRYAACLTWCKPSLGSGKYYCISTEHILFCVRGSLALARHDVGTCFQWPAGNVYREKPDQFFDLVKSCSPAPYAALFSGKSREGWFCWSGA